MQLRTSLGKSKPTLPDLHELERAKRLVEQELAKQMEGERRNADRYKAENEEDGDLWVVDEGKEEEVKEDAEDWTGLSPEKLDEVREQKQAEQRMQMEEMEDEMQQTRDQTQLDRDPTEREEMRKGKRHGMAKQLRDLETELDEVREQKQDK